MDEVKDESLDSSPNKKTALGRSPIGEPFGDFELSRA